MSEYVCGLPIDGMASFVSGTITIPVREEIVRCRNCRNASVAELDGSEVIACHGPLVQTWDYYNDEPLTNPVPPDGFCAWGVRKVDE